MAYPVILLFLCPVIFLAGFIDSVAGGGGIITIPAYLFAGLPIHSAYGTNKFAMCIGTSVSAYTYFKNGHIVLKSALISSAGALIASWFGAQIALYLSSDALKISLLCIVPLVTLCIFFKSTAIFRSVQTASPVKPPALYVLCIIIGTVLGAYDGFFGPGTGMFLLLAFSIITKYDAVTASGNAKLVNLASNLAALSAYIIDGKVVYAVALPCAVCAIGGNFLGSRLAIKNGITFIRPIFIIVTVLLCIQIICDLI